MKLSLLADDLTGALDSAVQFLPLSGRLPVIWDEPLAPQQAGSIAMDAGTRELPPAKAEARMRLLAHRLRDADLGYLKLDSLLRGYPAEAVRACHEAGGFDHAIIAPAFPAQSRITSGGRQWWRPPGQGAYQIVGLDLASLLAATVMRPGAAAPYGMSLWDAESEEDLSRIVSAGRALPGRVLWCGAAGLAAALAGTPPPVERVIRPPLLALIGTDHPVSLGQVRNAALWHLPLTTPVDPGAHNGIIRRLERDRALVITVSLPAETGRGEAAARIGTLFGEILKKLDPPSTLFICGGETLRAVCTFLGAQALEVRAEYAPGIPRSRLSGGIWDGTEVISKSGAFGAPDLLAEIITQSRMDALT